MKAFLSTTLCLFSCYVFGQTTQQIENQMAFGKFYGYVKYFYPGDDAAKIDWDKFAIYGAQKVESCKTASELKDSLNALSAVLMPGVKIMPISEKFSFPTTLTPSDISGYKEITWQHLGVGLVRNKQSIYQSARTNRPTIYKQEFNGFGTISDLKSAADLKGKTFVFTGKAKMLSASGQGQLWLRVDRDNGTVGFFDNMNNRPIKSKNWQTFEIKGTINNDAKQVLFGAFLLNQGQFAVDDLSLKVDGKEIYKNDFEGEEIEKEPKTINFNTGKSSIEGVKYAFAVNTENQNKFIEISSPKNVVSEQIVEIKPFEKHANFGEYIEKPINNELKIVVPLVLYGTKEHTFPLVDSVRAAQALLAINKLKQEQLTVQNPYLRIGNIINTWNVFQHFFPYFDVAKTDWNADLKEALAETYNNPSDEDFSNTLKKLTAKLKDGHISVSSVKNTHSYLPQFAWKFIENNWVITSVFDKNSALKVGDIVQEINGQDSKTYFKTVNQYISSATAGYLNHRAEIASLLGPKDSKLEIQVAGNPNKMQFVRNLNGGTYWALLPRQDTIKSLGNKITYISIGNAKMKKINDSLKLLKDSKAIICDLRGYPTDNTELIEYLMVKNDTSSRWMQIPQIIYPDQENKITYRYERWPLKAKSPHLKAKVFFLIDGQAISYAESYMSFIEHYKLATIIGQPTAGTNGNVNSISLPAGYTIRFTGMKVVKHDGSQHHGVGIIPNIYVAQTINGVKEGRDEVLERAIAEASK
ncbi:S41 family peptidase [Pedobacter sp. MW01-1-1]|uniref:S41 family peptidase n=1 Tax=Pedobacter sp. MW01-1-1 TaxID=3383027 RepID=UPI003FEED8A9